MRDLGRLAVLGAGHARPPVTAAGEGDLPTGPRQAGLRTATTEAPDP